MDLGAPFIFFNLYMFLGVFYGVLVVFKYPIRNRREKIYKIMICSYGGQEKLKGEGGLISFFLNYLFLEGKSMSLLKFFCCLGVYLKLCLRSKVNLGVHKYADGGPIMDVRVG
jgi:hypothetical protein